MLSQFSLKNLNPLQTFEQMLRKPVYAGWLTVKSWRENKRGNFDPLVSQNVFDTVQTVLSGKRGSLTPRLRSNPDFPLRQFVKCGCCDRPLTASWSKGRSKRYAFYFCPNSRGRGVSVSKADLESRFVIYLERMQPKPQFVKLFNAIVLEVWKEKQAQNLALSASLQHQIEDLHGRKDRLIDLRTDKEIEQEDFRRRLDKLNEEITLAEMQERDTKLEGYDVEGVLAFAEHVILNAARLWTEFSSDQKERLQRVLFPEGVTFASGEFRTAATCPLFKLLEQPEDEKSTLATLPGIEPGLPP